MTPQDAAVRLPQVRGDDEDLGRGARVRVMFDGTLYEADHSAHVRIQFPDAPGHPILAVIPWGAIVDLHEIKPSPPSWRAGDVVTIINARDPDLATLLRGPERWYCPVHSDGHTDGQIDADWSRGDVTHVLRDGRPVTS
jgi:hypothetical protein